MSQQRWLAKSPKYFSQPKHADRVRKWRQARKQAPQNSRGVAEALEGLAGSGKLRVLQDLCPLIQDSIMRNPLIVGLIAYVFECSIEDSMEAVYRNLIARGNALLKTNRPTPVTAGGTSIPSTELR